MKVPGRLLTDCIGFSITNAAVLAKLSPVDFTPDFTSRMISAKLISVEDNGNAIVEVYFDYDSLSNGQATDMVVMVSFTHGIGYQIEDISETSN